LISQRLRLVVRHVTHRDRLRLAVISVAAQMRFANVTGTDNGDLQFALHDTIFNRRGRGGAQRFWRGKRLQVGSSTRNEKKLLRLSLPALLRVLCG
jgi:hypothetical protein